jgi:hypothetical protein
MSKIMNVTWSESIVPKSHVARFLTEKNFQPGKFHLIEPSAIEGSNFILVIYLVEEKEMQNATQ